MEEPKKKYNDLLEDLWNQSHEVSHSSDAEASWHQFAERVGIKEKREVIRMRAIYYAAAVIALTIAIGSFIYHQTRIDYLVVENPGIGYKKVILPDSSMVSIAQGTTLYYAQNFNEKRSVRLEGDGYFEVQRNEALPFTVACYKTLTTVLGTSFNIKSDRRENVDIALYEGSIKASVEGVKNDWLLTPGEQLKYRGHKKISIEPFNNFFNPLESNFDLENVSVKELITYVKEIFGYEIVIDTEYLNNSITLRINKNDSLQNIIEVISTIYKLKPEIDEDMKRITLSK